MKQESKITLKIKTAEDMIKLGELIGSICYPKLVLAMNGTLGAGKTTLTKGLGKALGITKTINSPTFTIMKIYEGRIPLYHLDVYRIESSASDFELEEYFYLDGVSVVEWADNIKDLLPEDALNLTFNIDDEGIRTIDINTYNQEFLDKLTSIAGEYIC